jgi:serine/threonine protein kinase
MAGYSDFRFIGSGGFSRVYTARQERFARTVAVKVITVELSADALRRFGREQATAGRLDGHPHVIRAYESGFTESGQPYLTMEYHERGSLADRLRREGPLPADEVVAIGVKLACALDAAHRRGVIHRDVKPQNVLVSPFVGPVLADFGIAAVDDARLNTVTGEAFTALHVAPEVLEGLPASPSADLYSLASTLYELTTGQAPFAAGGDDGLLGLMRRVRTGEVPPIARPDVPPPMAAALVALLARDPQQRPPTGLALAERLRHVEAEAGWPQTSLVANGWTAPTPNGRAATGLTEWAGAPSSNGHGHRPGHGLAGSNGPASVGAGPPLAAPPTPPLPDAQVEATVTRPPVVRSSPAPLAPAQDHRGWRRPVVSLVVALVVLAGGTAWWVVDRQDDDRADGGRRPETSTPGPTAAPSVTGTGIDTGTEPGGSTALPPCPEPGSLTVPDQPLAGGAAPTTLDLEVSGDGTAATLRWDDPNAGRSVYVAFVSCDAPSDDNRRAVGVIAPGEPPEVTVDGLSLDFNYCFTVGVWGADRVTAYRSPEGHSYLCLDQTTR